MKNCDSAEKVIDVMVMEQLLNMLVPDVRLWVRERSQRAVRRLASLLTIICKRGGRSEMTRRPTLRYREEESGR